MTSTPIIVQIQKKADGPWHEVATVRSHEEGETVAGAILRSKGCVSYRLLADVTTLPIVLREQTPDPEQKPLNLVTGDGTEAGEKKKARA